MALVAILFFRWILLAVFKVMLRDIIIHRIRIPAVHLADPLMDPGLHLRLVTMEIGEGTIYIIEREIHLVEKLFLVSINLLDGSGEQDSTVYQKLHNAVQAVINVQASLLAVQEGVQLQFMVDDR